MAAAVLHKLKVQLNFNPNKVLVGLAMWAPALILRRLKWAVFPLRLIRLLVPILLPRLPLPALVLVKMLISGPNMGLRLL